MRATLVRQDEHGFSTVAERLERGEYDRLLADFRRQMDAAIAALRAHHETMMRDPARDG